MLPTNPQTQPASMARKIAGSVVSPGFATKPCSRCGTPRDRGRQRLCKQCHADNMRAWREKHLTVPKDGMLHVKPFVNEAARDRFEIREEDGGIVVVLDGNPLALDPPVEDRAEAESIVEALAKRLPKMPLLAIATHHLQGDGEFAEW